ncbi:MAG: hypothetical protein ACXWV0_03775 [Flavisolibacter sp.]
MNRKILTGFIIIFLLAGCYYDVEEELYGSCQTGTVTFSTTINNILVSNSCLGCHSGPTSSGNINLDGYQNVKAKVDDGSLFGSISHANGFVPMPQGASKLTNCDISKVKAWIDAGAPDN